MSYKIGTEWLGVARALHMSNYVAIPTIPELPLSMPIL